MTHISNLSPGLLGAAFIGGEGPCPDRCRRILAEVPGRLLIAAADSGLIAAEAAGFCPDWVVGDMDSLDDPARLEKYPPERVRRYPRDKDFLDTELALSLLWEKGCAETWVLGGGGGRLDHLLGIRSLFERERFPARWITAREDVRALEAPGELSLEIPPGGRVSVFPLGPGPWEAESRGLKWTLAGLSWNRGFIGVSNVAESGIFEVRALRGRFMVMTEA
ncbi:MAG: thiamine diphosphokinase [Treponema sp.]|nr:thiamine diphosphokinase [Treponema sp.]